MKPAILLALTLIPILAGSIPVTERYMDTGRLLAAFALPGGKGITVTLQSDYQGYYFFSLVYVDTHGTTNQSRTSFLGQGAPPDSVTVDVCGRYVQMYANWVDGYELSTAPVYRYMWELPEESGLCTTGRVFLPIIER